MAGRCKGDSGGFRVLIAEGRRSINEVKEEILHGSDLVCRGPLAPVGAGCGSCGQCLKVSTALSEIVVGTVAHLVIGAPASGNALGAEAKWALFLLAPARSCSVSWPEPNSIQECFARIGKSRPPSASSDSPRRFLGDARCPPCRELGLASGVAGRRGAFHNFCGGGLCRHAGVGVQPDQLCKANSGCFINDLGAVTALGRPCFRNGNEIALVPSVRTRQLRGLVRQ